MEIPQPSDHQQLARQLQQLKALHRLEEQFGDRVTSYLSQAAENGFDLSLAEADLFQTTVTGLSEILEGEWVAIAHSTTVADPVNSLFTLQYAVFPANKRVPPSYPDSEATRSSIEWPLAASSGLRLTLGQSIPLHQLHTLHTCYPDHVRLLLSRPTEMAWLLVYPGDFATFDDCALDARTTAIALIEQTLARSLSALHQVQLAHTQQQRTYALQVRNQELEQTNRLKSEFLANTSHEIRTPLSSILGFTHLLQQQGFNAMNLRHQEYLKIILSSGQHLLALINDILDLSKIEANQMSLHWELVDVPEVCHIAVTLVREKASDRGLKINLDIAPSVKTLAADGLRLKQMLFNLLSNAVKFTVKGEIGLQVRSVDQALHFTIWDTGTGISPEQQALLFKPYSQIANSVVGRSEGTGLGLVLTQKLAELHGGSITVASELNQGSRFTVILPFREFETVEDLSGVELPVQTQSRPLRSPQSSPDPARPTPQTTAARDRTQDSTNSPHRIASAPQCQIKPSQSQISPPGLTPNQRLVQTLSPAIATEPVSSKLLPTNFMNEIGSELSGVRKPNQNNGMPHILLVEDNLHNAKLVITFLNRLGYQITWAQNGKDLWENLQHCFANESGRSLPSLILMDVNLPDSDGLTLTRQLKEDERYQAIPVIAQTAMAMKGDRSLCLNSGANDYISKPIDLDVLAQLVAKYINAKTD